MSDVKQLKAQPRSQFGTGPSRALRREKRVPAIIYGADAEPTAISVDFKEINKLIYAGGFKNTVFDIDVDGSVTRVLPREYQLHPVKDTPVHIDFLRLSQGQSVKVVVPVHILDQETCPGLKAGGALQIVEHSLELMAPPDAIPDAIEVSVAALNIGESVHLEDITLPNGTQATSRENVTIVTVVPPMELEEEPVAAPATPAP